MAAAAWSDVEELEEGPFRRVPCKREKYSWKVFLFCSLLERVRVGVIFWEVVV